MVLTGSASSTCSISLKNLGFSYTDHNCVYPVLSNIDLEIGSGEFVCVIGKSGCGKTTLLNLIAGLLSPTEGEILIDGNPVTCPGTDRAVVFQHYSLFPWMTARKNVAFGIRQAGKARGMDESLEVADIHLTAVGMDSDREKFPYQLSGGMQQRVAIARAIAMDARILLLDEPFGALDAKMRVDLQNLIERIWFTGNRDGGTGNGERRTVVFVTHDIDEAVLLADRILFINSGGVEHDIAVPFERPRTGNRRALANFKRDLTDMFFSFDEEIARTA